MNCISPLSLQPASPPHRVLDLLRLHNCVSPFLKINLSLFPTGLFLWRTLTNILSFPFHIPPSIPPSFLPCWWGNCPKKMGEVATFYWFGSNQTGTPEHRQLPAVNCEGLCAHAGHSLAGRGSQRKSSCGFSPLIVNAAPARALMRCSQALSDLLGPRRVWPRVLMISPLVYFAHTADTLLVLTYHLMGKEKCILPMGLIRTRCNESRLPTLSFLSFPPIPGSPPGLTRPSALQKHSLPLVWTTACCFQTLSHKKDRMMRLHCKSDYTPLTSRQKPTTFVIVYRLKFKLLCAIKSSILYFPRNNRSHASLTLHCTYVLATINDRHFPQW